MRCRLFIIRSSALLAIGVFTLSCSPQCLRASEQLSKLVAIQGADNCGLDDFEPAQKGEPLYMPLLWFGSDPSSFLYLKNYGRHPSVDCSKVGLRSLNGKTVGIDLYKDEAWQWLEKASSEELRALLSVRNATKIDGRKLALLKRLSEQNSKLDELTIEDAQWRQVLSLFDPERLSIESEPLEARDRAILASKKRLKSLSIKTLEDISLLSQMQNLEVLAIQNWDPGKTGPLPKSLKNLKSLAVDLKAENLTPLGERPNLKELILAGSSNVDLNGLANFPKLNLLVIESESAENLASLRGLKHLKWLSLSLKTTQQLLEIVHDHPDLLGLMIFAEKDIDLTALKKLRQLKCLLVPAPNDPAPLCEMKKLEWLAIYDRDESPKETQKEVLSAKLQRALPGTAVVRMKPICLGSGWILLLAPAIGAAWLIERWRSHKELAPGVKDVRI